MVISWVVKILLYPIASPNTLIAKWRLGASEPAIAKMTTLFDWWDKMLRLHMDITAYIIYSMISMTVMYEKMLFNFEVNHNY
jgi:hypothetical protein